VFISSQLYSSELIQLSIARDSKTENSTTLLATAILREALRRNNIGLNILYIPSKRSLGWSNAGRIDGELFRVKNIAQLSPENTQNLVRVEYPLIDIKIAAFTARDIKVTDWKSLQSYKIHYIRGRKALAKKLPKFVPQSDINTTNDLTQAMRILAVHRTDIVLANAYSANMLIASDPQFKGINKGQVIQSIQLFTYLNNRHAHLAPLIGDTLREMRLDRTYLEIRNQIFESNKNTDPLK